MDELAGFKNITLTEAIEEIKNLRQSLIGAVQNAECREEKKDKEIERLKKVLDEIKKVIENHGWINITLFEKIEQALKEGE